MVLVFIQGNKETFPLFQAISAGLRLIDPESPDRNILKITANKGSVQIQLIFNKDDLADLQRFLEGNKMKSMNVAKEKHIEREIKK